jgi:NADH dehydrogenase
LQASDHSPSRLVRAKAAAERAVVGSSVPHTVFALGWVYARDDPFMALTGRMSRLPVMVISGSGAARFEPIWAEDVADCVMAALPGGAHGDASERSRYELAGPQTLSYQEIVATVLAAWHRPRPFVRMPLALVRPGLRLGERLLGARAPATWEEAQLLELTLLSARGTADAESLGVVPRTMARALVEGP